MQIERKALLAALEKVKPAISISEIVEELSHVWLDGKTLTAYNDTSLGIQVPFESDVIGGINGKLILDILGSAGTDEVTIESPAKEEVLVKAGRTRLKAALLAPSRAVWNLPTFKKGDRFNLPAGFIEALKAISISLSPKTSVPDQLGVNCVFEKGALQLYTTDAATISWATFKTSGWPFASDVSVSLPAAFIDQVVKLEEEGAALFLTPTDVLAVSDGVKIFAKTIDVVKMSSFHNIIQKELKSLQLFPIPDQLKLALVRAAALKEEFVNAKIAAGELHLHVDSALGDLKERVKLEAKPKEVACRFDPKLIKRGLPYCENMGISERATVLTGKNYVHLVGNLSAETAEASDE